MSKWLVIETHQIALRVTKIVASLGVLVASACADGRLETPDPPPAPRPLTVMARLRVRNVGIRPIHQLVVVYPTQRVRFGDVVPGELTTYRDVPDGVREQMLLDHVLEGRLIEPFVIDWHGSNPKAFSGNFTYDLLLKPAFDQIRVVRIGRDR